MNNYSIKERSLETLENNIWDASGVHDQSFLIRKCNELRKKRLGEFSIEDFRIMIGQKIGLNYLVPLALKILTTDLFAEGDYYEGDLLQSLLNIHTEFWVDHADYWNQLNELIKDRRVEISDLKIDLTKFDTAEVLCK